tara:strand:- start:4 stop:666 length:663 start_codon:yes stop_codon:yes gene_type:complete
VTDAHKPKVPLFASRATPLQAPSNEKENNRSKRRLSISLMLLIASAIIGSATIIWTGFLAESENIEINLETVSRTPTNQLQLTGAEYAGVTESGLEYNIKADRVVEIKERAGLLHLYEADGWISSKTNGMTTLLSKEAVYNSTTATLDMSGDVQIHQKKQDMLVKSQKMTALIGTGDLKTDMPVSVTGPRIELISEGMVSERRGEIIVFTGQTQARLKQK